MGKTIDQLPCSKCGSKDNLKVFIGKDGKERMKCMTPGCDNTKVNNMSNKAGNAQCTEPLNFTESYRGISSSTLNYLGIKYIELDRRLIIVYEHNNIDGSFDIKYRYPDKKFSWATPKNETTSMFALDKCMDFTRPLYITEGNEDAATLWDLGFQACSLLSAGSEVQNIEQDLETINKFPEIILCIDQDKAGKAATANIKQLLSHKLVKVVDLSPRKDANEWVREDLEEFQPDRDELVQKCINCIENVPTGIIFGHQINLTELRKPLPKGIAFPYPKLQEFTNGILPGNMMILTAGVSIGKSSVLRDFSVYFRKQGYKVANLYVEEDSRVSQQNYIAAELGYPIGAVMQDPTIIPEDDWFRVGKEILDNQDLMFIDEKWERTTTNLLATIKYLAEVKRYDIILLDHITAIINSSSTSRNGRVQDIDWLCEQLFSLGRNTGVRLLLVSHLKRPQTPPYWDEGRKPTMYDLRGSGSLEGKPDIIIGLSRNQKSEFEADVLKLEVLKNRWFSKLGLVDELIYINDTGRLMLR